MKITFAGVVAALAMVLAPAGGSVGTMRPGRPAATALLANAAAPHHSGKRHFARSLIPCVIVKPKLPPPPPPPPNPQPHGWVPQGKPASEIVECAVVNG